MELPGPCGCFQLAPFCHFHHCATLSRSPNCLGGLNTRDAATNMLSGGLGVPGGSCFLSSSQSGFLSAVVIYPVAFTKSLKLEFVTSVASIQKADNRTLCCGYSSAFPS